MWVGVCPPHTVATPWRRRCPYRTGPVHPGRACSFRHAGLSSPTLITWFASRDRARFRSVGPPHRRRISAAHMRVMASWEMPAGLQSQAASDVHKYPGTSAVWRQRSLALLWRPGRRTGHEFNKHGLVTLRAKLSGAVYCYRSCLWLWCLQRAGGVGPEDKQIYNQTMKQYTKPTKS